MGSVGAGHSDDRELDVYARISFALNGDTIKTDDQKEMAEVDITRRGGRVGRVFEDNSLSAWKPNVVRPQWEDMMARIESGESGGVWVLDLTRFTRKPIEGERLIQAAQNGARVLSRSMEYDLMTADGRAAFREAIVKAAQESDKISERVKLGKRRRARRGLSAGGGRGYGMPGRGRKPQGWRKGDPLPDPVPADQVDAERELIREGYRRILAGESGSAVVADLTARGVRALNGKPFTVPGFFSMLRRPAVAGLLNDHGDAVGEMVGAEPIVSREQWERLCAILDARKTGRPAGKVHVLSNLVFCPCGAPMRGRPAKGTYEDGAPCREYRCMVGCGRNAIDARVLERAVAVGVKTRLGDPKRAARLATRAARVRGEKAKIQAEIDRLNADADSLAEKVATWGQERVEKAMAPLLRRINALETQKAGLEEPESAHVAAREVAEEWDRAHEAGDLETMRGMVRTAFPRLAVRYRSGWGDHSTERIAWDGDVERPDVAA